MARQGRGGPALATAAIGSFVAGLIATLLLAFLAPQVVKLALALGPREYFALMVLAFVTVSATFGDSALRGLTSLFIGLALACVGIDGLTGAARLTYGVPQLMDGIETTTLAVALFAIGEALAVAAMIGPPDAMHRVTGRVSMTAQDWKRSWKAWLRGTFIGFPIGRCQRAGRTSPRSCPMRPSGS